MSEFRTNDEQERRSEAEDFAIQLRLAMEFLFTTIAPHKDLLNEMREELRAQRSFAASAMPILYAMQLNGMKAETAARAKLARTEALLNVIDVWEKTNDELQENPALEEQRIAIARKAGLLP